MERYKNLILIGTSHIAIESVNTVREIIESEKPDVVALELDYNRFAALMSKKKDSHSFWKAIRTLGIKGFIFNLLGAWVENKLGKIVGVKPGSEMKQAAISAKGTNAKIAMIDQDIRITIKKLIKGITWREKFRFIGDIFKAILFRKPIIEPFDLRTVPKKETVKKLTMMLKKSYPSVYNTLIKERNEIMAKNLYNLMNFGKIVAVVGAGHEDEIIGLIEKNVQHDKKRSD
ncbi:TraB/GumN family protein [Candidatus Woesearchaeota archaeon]|nr:TraB/GumN family protein [Candidatus Woesearchaeota archaeon]